MDESKEKILAMLQEGSITPEEADRLLLAVGNASWETVTEDEMQEGGSEQDSSPDEKVADAMGSPSPPPTMPDFARMRDSWQTPFSIALATLATFVMLLVARLRSTQGAWTFGIQLLSGAVFFLALVVAYLWSSRDGLWLHVRIQEAGGSRFRLSLPLSTRLLRWGLQSGRNYADEKAQEYLEMVENLLTAWEQDPNQDPLIIDIDDDGDKVQVFIG